MSMSIDLSCTGVIFYLNNNQIKNIFFNVHPTQEIHCMTFNDWFWMLCSGAPWCNLPERYGPCKTVYNRFNRWSNPGVINIIFNKLFFSLDAHNPADWSATAQDGSNIRAHICTVGAHPAI